MQLSLAARGHGRGGYRAGAGRPRGRSDHYVPHVRREQVSRHQGVHVTLERAAGLPSLRRPRAHALIVAVLGAEKRRQGFRLVHYAVRPDHLHLICEADDTRALSRGIQRIGARLGRGLNRMFGRSGRLFRDRFHGRVIKTPRQMRNTLRYVLLNHGSVAGAAPDGAAADERRRHGELLGGIDAYSSGPWFDGWKGRRSRAGPDAAAPVTAPCSWLLRIGWRRGGLIDWDDVPR